MFDSELLVAFASSRPAKAIEGSGPRTDEIRTLQLQPRTGQSPVLWLALQGGGVARLADGGWTRWHVGNSALPSDFVSDLVLVEVPGAGLDVWAGTRSGLAILRNGREWVGADPRIPQLRERVRTLALTKTSQGVPVMWAGSDTGAVRTPLDGPWRLVSRMGSSGNGIWDVWVEPAADGGDRVWLASDGEGLGRYEHGHWRRYGRADGLPSDSARSIRRVPDGGREGLSGGDPRPDQLVLVPLRPGEPTEGRAVQPHDGARAGEHIGVQRLPAGIPRDLVGCLRRPPDEPADGDAVGAQRRHQRPADEAGGAGDDDARVGTISQAWPRG